MANSTGDGAPPSAPPGTPPPRARTRPKGAPRPTIDVAPPPPETSARSAQSVMLGLGALLLGVAAVAFVGVLGELDPWGRLAILLAVALLGLAVPIPLAARGLTATAEAIAVVGLVLIGAAAYALWSTGTVTALSVPTYAGLASALTAGVGYGHHRLTGLPVPRFAGLILLQPIWPLLAYGVATGPADWALVLTLVATQNAVLGHLDLRLDLPASRRRLRYLAWAAHGVALLIAAGFAVVALVRGQTVDAAIRSAVTLLIVAAVGQVGALTLRRAPLPEVAAGALTLAVVGGACRVLTVALPGPTLLPVTAVVAITGGALVLLPPRARRGPGVALGVAAGLLGLVVAALALRAGAATVTAVLPPWSGDLDGYAAHLADAVAGTGWQLPTAAAALTGGAAAVPGPARRDALVVTGALTALAVPAGYGLGPMLTPWVLVVTGAVIAVAALGARSHRSATGHLAAAGVLCLVAAGASLATPMLTATILAAITIAAVIVAWGQPPTEVAHWVTGWAAGAAALFLPAAVTTAAVTMALDASRIITAGAVAVCLCVGYAALLRLRDGTVPPPVLGGAALGALLLAVTALATTEATLADRMVTGLLAVGGALVVAAPRIDAARPASWRYDGNDLAAAVVTAGVVATLARLSSLVLPVGGAQSALAIGALLILLVALGIRALPPRMRRGPVLGLAGFAVIVAGVAGVAAVVGAARAIAVRWSGDLTAWPPEPAWSGVSWAAPFALAVLAVAARLVLPRPIRYDVTAGLVLLATVGAPPALGAAWWSPTALCLTVGGVYALSIAAARRADADARAAQARAITAALLWLAALVTAAGQRWLLATALAAITLTAVAVAGLIVAQPTANAGQRRMGGVAVTVALLAAPAGLAAFASHLGHSPQGMITVALAGSSLGLATLAVARDQIRGYLPYGTVGVAAGATAAALLTFATPYPPGVYAAAAALLGVLAELVRASAAPAEPTSAESTSIEAKVSPPAGAVLAAAVPTVVALVGVAPALFAALLAPYRLLGSPWQGPPVEATTGPTVAAPSVLAMLLLTLAAALAAVGFGGVVSRQAAPVIAPGLAVTILIAPGALGAPWPAATVAALVVFVIAGLGLALTPPPPPGYRARPLRVTRRLVLAIAVAAGGAGLAGSLADPWLAWAALAVTVSLGTVTALAGRTEPARLVGWWFAALSAQLFALDTAHLSGAAGARAAFFSLAVAAIALAAVPRLPRLRRAAAARERWVVEWAGGYLGLLIAVGLGSGSLADLATVLIGAGVVAGVAALRPGRTDGSRRALLWTAAGSEITAWWIFMWLAEVDLIELYSLPFAVLALVVGGLEARHRPQLSSWVVFGPALVAALAPSLLAVVVTGGPPARQAWVLIGGVAAIVVGSRRGQRAPLIVGAVVTAVAALHLLSLAGPWLMLIPIGLVLLILGANNERRQRDLERLRGAYSRMR